MARSRLARKCRGGSPSRWARPAPSPAPSCADGSEFPINFGHRADGDLRHKLVEDLKQVEALPLAQPADPVGIIADGQPHNLALRFRQTRRGPGQLRRGHLIKGNVFLTISTPAYRPPYRQRSTCSVKKCIPSGSRKCAFSPQGDASFSVGSCGVS